MKEALVELIVSIVVILVVVCFIAGCVLYDERRDNKLWNYGHCPACGSEWEYEQAVGHHYSTYYIYVCNKCGRRIEISEIR